MLILAAHLARLATFVAVARSQSLQYFSFRKDHMVTPFRTLQIAVAFVATIPLLSPHWTRSAFAEDQPASIRTTPSTAARLPDMRPFDVVLGAGNILSGRVVTSLNQPVVDAGIIVTHHRQEIARVVTNASGDFQAQLPCGGVCLITTPRSSLVVRTWTEAAAPPTAIRSVEMIERFTLRGQNEDCEPKRGHGKGLLLLGIAAALAAAIVIPLVILDRHEDLENETPKSP